MPVIIPNSMSQVVLTFDGLSAFGSTPITTFGVDMSPTLEAVDAVYDWWHDFYRPQQMTGTQLVSIRAYNALQEYTASVGENGTQSGLGDSPQLSALVQKRTGLVGRRNRGRMYWPHVLEDGDVNYAGQVAGAKVTALQTVATELESAFAAFDAQLMLFHNDVSDATPVTSLVVQAQVATQRRRNRA